MPVVWLVTDQGSESEITVGLTFRRYLVTDVSTMIASQNNQILLGFQEAPHSTILLCLLRKPERNY